MKRIFKISLVFVFLVSVTTLMGQTITNSGANQTCGNASGFLSVSGYTVSYWEEGKTVGGTWQWIQNISGSTCNYSVTAPTPGSGNLSAVKEFKAVLSSGSKVGPIMITAYTVPVAGTVSGTASYKDVAPSGTIQLTGQTGSVLSTTMGSPFGAQTSVTFPYTYSNLTSTTAFTATIGNGVCTNVQAQATVTVYKTGTLTVSASDAYDGQKIKVLLNDSYYSNSPQWETSIDNGATWQISTFTGGDHVVSQSIKFRVRLTLGSFGQFYTNVATITRRDYSWFYTAGLIGENWIKTQDVMVKNITTPSAVDALDHTQKILTTEFIDGFARPIQTNIKRGSFATNDIVGFQKYDARGRQAVQYLPYVPSATTGAYRTDPISDQTAFYTAANDKVANGNATATTLYEPSPRGRVTEVGGVGSAWQPGNGHTQKINYYTNTSSGTDQIRYFTPALYSDVFYNANELVVVESVDPDGKKIQTITDKSGKTIVKRIQLDETVDGIFVPWMETYYVHNTNGSLKYIIQPKGVQSLKTGSGGVWGTGVVSPGSTFKNQYVFEFVYDAYGRIVEKKVPGQGWSYFCYDRLDRLVLMQDENLRPLNKWAFIKYDRLGRPVMQGLYLNSTYLTRATIQTNVVDPLYAVETDKYYEERMASTAHGYSNQVFPTTNAEIWTVNYYDNHDFDNNGTADYLYVVQGLLNENTPAVLNYGRATGSKRLILGTTTWLSNYVFYDEDGRIIQTRSNNHLWSALENLTTAVYDFAGQLKIKKTYHKTSATGIVTVINKFENDHMGRLTKVWQSNNGAADQLVAQYWYNELGQLIDKKLHNTTGTSFLQSVDMRYNLQGWLASINNSTLTDDTSTDAKNDDTGDYFGIEYIFESPETGLTTGTNDVYFNGNTSVIKWKGVGIATGAEGQRSFKFSYDKANRLKDAVYARKSVTAWDKEANALNEIVTYDQNGNIKSLTRNQLKYSVANEYVSENIDNLTYTYGSPVPSGDPLLKITDASITAGFDNGGSGTGNDYTYDASGNLTSDLNKGISAITYNPLGKASTINFSDGRKIEYVFDASGVKLTMKTYAAGPPQVLTTTTHYVDGFIYENDTLRFFSSPEGRVVKNKNGTLEYQYAIADKQGNTRVIFTSATPVVESTTVNFESATNANVVNYSRSAFDLFDHTDAGATYTYSQVLNGGNSSKVGVGKSFKVYPGDKVKIEAYAKYLNSPGTTNPTGFVTALPAAFGVSAQSTGELAKVYSALTSYGGILDANGVGGSPTAPKAFVNIIVFDKNHNPRFADNDQIDVNATQDINTTVKAPHDLLSKELTIQEEGYVYMYVSNGNGNQLDVYFDDITFTYSPTNVIQYNDYYPWGLQTTTSWTRQGSKNDFLYNEGSELNMTTGWYETFFRNYDAIIGRFTTIDPLATKYASVNPYNYGLNNPVTFNDPQGAESYGPTDTYNGPAGYNDDNGNWHWYDQGPAGEGMSEQYQMALASSRNHEYEALLAHARRGNRMALVKVIETHGGVFTTISKEAGQAIAGVVVTGGAVELNFTGSKLNNIMVLHMGGSVTQNDFTRINQQYGWDFIGKYRIKFVSISEMSDQGALDAISKSMLRSSWDFEMQTTRNLVSVNYPGGLCSLQPLWMDFAMGDNEDLDVFIPIFDGGPTNYQVYTNPDTLDSNGNSLPMTYITDSGTLISLTIYFRELCNF